MESVIKIFRQKSGGLAAFDVSSGVTYQFEFGVHGYRDDIQIDWIEVWDLEGEIKPTVEIENAIIDELYANHSGLLYEAWLDREIMRAEYAYEDR